MTYNEYAIERRDIGRIDKLNKLTEPKTFWADVKKRRLDDKRAKNTRVS